MQQKLLDRKSNQCRKLQLEEERIRHLKNQTNVTDSNRYESSSSSSFRCTINDPLTINDVFNNPDLIRVIFKGGAVHRFYSTVNIDHLNDLIIVERASLSSLMARLKQQRYVLIEESKLIDYLIDNECDFTAIDVVQERNPIIDDIDGERNPLINIRKEELFQNDIAIAFSKSFLDSVPVSRNFESSQSYRNWINEFDRSIEILKKSGVLKLLQDRHWSRNCNRALNSSADYIFSWKIFHYSLCFKLIILILNFERTFVFTFFSDWISLLFFLPNKFS